MGWSGEARAVLHISAGAPEVDSFLHSLNREMSVNKFQTYLQVLLAVVAVNLVGCSNNEILPPPTEAEFSTGAFSVPFPSDVFTTYAGVVEAGLQLASAPGAEFTNSPIIPSADDPADTGDPIVAQGFLDGFSVTSPMQLDFTHNIDPSSVIGGQSIRVFEISIVPPSVAAVTPGVDVPIALPNSIIRELQPDSDYTATMARSVGYQIVVRPRVPWPASDNTSLGGLSRGIMVVVTNDLRDFRGNPVIRSDQYNRMANGIGSNTGNAGIDSFANAVGAMVGQSLALVAGQGINPADVIISNTFTCQSVTDVVDAAVAQTLALGPFATTPGVLPTAGGNPVPGMDTVLDYLVATGSVPAGTALPYNPSLTQATITLPTFYPGDETPAGQLAAITGYLTNADAGVVYQSSSAAPNPAFPSRFDPILQQQGSSEIPVLIATPNTPGPWPVIIFQHGITRSRFDMLAFAPLFCGSGFAVVSMDAPLHGTEAVNPYAAQIGSDASVFGIPGIERTFGIDFVDNVTGDAPGGDGPDPSGTYFLNFPSLISSRSVWTQAVCDLAALTEALPSWDIDGDTAADFTGEVFYVGQSLGGLIGSTFLSAIGPGKIIAAELNVAGGHIAKLLENSPNYNPRLVAFFQDQGIIQGSTSAEQAITLISGIADGIDPICHIRRATENTNVHMSFTVGGNVAANKFGFFPPDLVVPTDTLGTGYYADFVGLPVSGIPTSGSDDDRIYTGIVEPSYLGGGLPMARIGIVPKGLAGTGINTFVRFPNGYTPSLSVQYTEGDHGIFADPTSESGVSMQQGVLTFFDSSTGTDVQSTLISGLYSGGVVRVIESNDVSIPIESGVTQVGEVVITTTDDPTNPVTATFDVSGDAGTLAAAAQAYGAHHFNWLQVVRSDSIPPNAPSNDLLTVGAPLPTPRISPPAGGTGQSQANADDGIVGDDKPWLWNEVQVPLANYTADQDTDSASFFPLREFTDNSTAPAPAGVDPAVGDPSLQTSLSYNVGPWLGNISDSGESVEVRVWLAAVDINGDAVQILRGFTFTQGEGTFLGNTIQVISGIAEMPGSPATTGDNDDALLIGF